MQPQDQYFFAIKDPVLKKILFIFLEMGREGEREGEKYRGEKHQSGAPHLCPDQGPDLQHRHVLGKKNTSGEWHGVNEKAINLFLST